MLHKPQRAVFVPAVPGAPAVPARAAYTVCTTPPAPGRWETKCGVVRVKALSNGAVQLPPGTVDFTLVEINNEVYADCNVCRTVWVSTGPTPPAVCTSYPAQPGRPAIPYAPPRVDYFNDFGWNGGANSTVERDGDVSLTFVIPKVVGVVVGLTNDRANVTSVNRLSHALYFHGNASGHPRFNVMESGRLITSDQPYAPADPWEIRRVAGGVSYWRAGVVVHTSRTPSSGPLSVGSALYATGDTIP